MVAPRMQQFQYHPKKNFLRRLVFPVLLGESDGSPVARGGGDFKGGGG